MYVHTYICTYVPTDNITFLAAAKLLDTHEAVGPSDQNEFQKATTDVRSNTMFSQKYFFVSEL